MKLSLIITHVQHIIQYRGYNTVEHIRLSTYQILLFRLLKFTPHHTRAYQIFTYSTVLCQKKRLRIHSNCSIQWSLIPFLAQAPLNGAEFKKRAKKEPKKEEEKREYHRRTVIEYSYRTEALLIINHHTKT